MFVVIEYDYNGCSLPLLDINAMSSRKLITKDNKLINASYSLGIPEQRIIFLAIIEARAQKQMIDARGVLQIHASSYQEQFKVEKHSAYKALKSAANGLFESYFEYEDIHEKTGKPAHRVVRWAQTVTYVDTAGMIELQFTDAVIPLITRLSEQYTEYDLKQVSELQSEYAIRLYELMMQWKSVGKTNKIALGELRSKLGVGTQQYKQMCNFKTRVLDLAVSQINQYTDITATYDQHKTGRTITAMSFTFKAKQAPELNIKDDTFIQMTDSQIELFSSKLAALSELGGNAPLGASTDAYAKIIANELRDTDKQKGYHKYLDKVGYQQHKN